MEFFFCNLAKCRHRLITTSQLYICVGTVVLPALQSNFVRYRGSRSHMFYKSRLCITATGNILASGNISLNWSF